MNGRQKKQFVKFIKQPVNRTIKASLTSTVSPEDQERAYTLIVEWLRTAQIPTGAAVLEANVKEAVAILKKELSLANLVVRKPIAAAAAVIELNTGVISFTDHNNELDSFTFQGDLNQGDNERKIQYSLHKCPVGIALAPAPVISNFFNNATHLTGEGVATERSLRQLAKHSLKVLPLGKGAKESARYYAAGCMEVQCTTGANNPVSFFVVSCGQNCDSTLANVSNEYHGEAFIYGAFLATLKILDLSAFDSVKLIIDYKASTDQGTACGSCAKLIPKLHKKILAIDKVTELDDHY